MGTQMRLGSAADESFRADAAALPRRTNMTTPQISADSVRGAVVAFAAVDQQLHRHDCWSQATANLIDVCAELCDDNTFAGTPAVRLRRRFGRASDTERVVLATLTAHLDDAAVSQAAVEMSAADHDQFLLARIDAADFAAGQDAAASRLMAPYLDAAAAAAAPGLPDAAALRTSSARNARAVAALWGLRHGETALGCSATAALGGRVRVGGNSGLDRLSDKARGTHADLRRTAQRLAAGGLADVSGWPGTIDTQESILESQTRATAGTVVALADGTHTYLQDAGDGKLSTAVDNGSEIVGLTPGRFAQIGKHLYAGNLAAADSYAPFRYDTVVSLCRTNVLDADRHIEVGLIDSARPDQNPNLEFVFADTAAAIDASVRAGRNTYVHCVAGASRTPSVLVAYLSRYCDMRPDAAFAHVAARMPWVSPNTRFRSVLGIPAPVMKPAAKTKNMSSGKKTGAFSASEARELLDIAERRATPVRVRTLAQDWALADHAAFAAARKQTRNSGIDAFADGISARLEGVGVDPPAVRELCADALCAYLLATKTISSPAKMRKRFATRAAADILASPTAAI